MPKSKNDMPEIKPDQDYALRPQTPEEREKWVGQDVPEFKIKLDLTEEQQARLKEQVFLEFEALKEERRQLKLEEKWKERDAQYDGQLAPIQQLDFQIDVRESKIKVDAVVRALMEAFLPDSGDIVDVSPRPEAGRKDGFAIAEKQQQFIDFSMDEEIRPEVDLRKIATCASKKYVGIGKISWDLNTQFRRREEHWEGKLAQVGTNPDGSAVYVNEGLNNFLSMYPDAPKRYPKQVAKLAKGESIDIVVQYKEQVSNNPVQQYVPIEDFYVRNCCNYNRGLASEHLIGERKRYSYWELKKLEREEEWENIEKLFENGDETVNAEKKDKAYMTKEYKVMEFTTYFRINPDDEDETKVKCWFDEGKKTFLAAFQYFYYSIDCDYIGYWLTINDKGFYGDAESLMFDLRDTHIAQDALISLLLQAIYVRNIITPITHQGSEVEQMFLDHEFKSGKPLVVGDELIDDVNKALAFVQWPSMDMNGGLVMLEKLKRIGSDVSRVADLVTGGESNLDPSAPASKTIALLQQSGVGIKDYIRTFLPSFNSFAASILQLYYQMSTEDRKYRIRSKSKNVTGKNVFDSIKREEMVVKTFVQARAAAFAFDKVNEKREAMAAYQVLMENPYTARQPKVLYKALKTFLGTFGGQWKAMSETDLPTQEQFDQQQLMTAVKAVALLVQQAKQQAQVTGVEPNMDEIVGKAPTAITEAQAVEYNPALAEEGAKK